MSDNVVFAHHPWTVQSLVERVSSGHLRLPDIQRPFVWSNVKVRDLVDSMYKGFPVGELMFWENGDDGHSRTIGAGTHAAGIQVVDGQQRLTALYAVLTGQPVWRDDYSRERVRIAFNPITERFDVATPAVDRSPEWIPDITRVFTDPYEARDDFIEALEADRTVARDQRRKIESAVQRLHNLRNYTFSVAQIKDDVTREQVADIFVRINSEGVALTSADFILTFLSVFAEPERALLERFARNSRFTPQRISELDDVPTTWSPRNPYLDVTPGQLVRVAIALGLRRGRLQNAYNYLRGRDPRSREVDPTQRDKALGQLQEAIDHVLNPIHWDEFLHIIERAGFRSRQMITSDNNILFCYALWLIGRVDFGVPIPELREVLARWFFMSQTTGRYTNSPETRIEEDVARIGALPDRLPGTFVAALDEVIASTLTDDWWTITLPGELETSAVRSPAFLAYLASLCILDADVLLSTMSARDWVHPARTNVKGIERHHLFPKDYLESVLGVRGVRNTNQVANFALIEWSDNIKISNQAPTSYWKDMVERKRLSGDWLARQLHWHALPEHWQELEYREFLRQRRRLIAATTRDGFAKLTDPAYQPQYPAFIPPTPAGAGRELPGLDVLVARGIVPAGTRLTAARAEGEATVEADVTDDGTIRVGTRVFATPHQAAEAAGFEGDDGWAYWAVEADGVIRTLTDLRLRAASS